MGSVHGVRLAARPLVVLVATGSALLGFGEILREE